MSEIAQGAVHTVELDGCTYSWSQTLKEVSITVPVPQGTRGKDLDIQILPSKLSVKLKGQVLFSGSLAKDVKVDDSTWTIDSQREVQIHLEKLNGTSWWECVIQGHAKIDTTKIQPENSKLEDLDGDTRAMVEKMMFDQRQKEMGKPSSDDLKKQDMLAKFQREHPEMDFSKAKMG
ncbi:nuclear movement protein nudC [Protomyces lactucae-debilis]|uniref:Nuclear movement protein nudC n=1 Tax=Protomyces lactucae-debilis TaxID=2754530 RepID=A0A1Y2FNN0_PROLT|nr:nuclear movement protein nudC [Protomyces lactucae-debilis]ORY84826.1 nuclear movement protein nudC [Protomyces lactucae-debilis]